MVDAIVLVAAGQLAQLPGAPRQPVGQRSRQCFGGGLFLQGLGVSEEPGCVVVGARDVRARRLAAVQP
ncbi:hypothetical protein ABT001_35370 [Streptomyces sp. NPDC002793]|uniref:hypothetical protein n=1 Tax=Streptomyces sp. NPDC002793 TaxID=3154432 RepID=UPI00332B2096